MIQITVIILTLTKIVIYYFGQGKYKLWQILPAYEQILNITKFVALSSNIAFYHPNLWHE
jgi:hypothetical protein